MPQIGWLEILVVVVLALLIVGPKDFPIVVKKVGSWVGAVKNYFHDIQKEVTETENIIKDDISLTEESLKDNKKEKDNESKN